MATFEQMCADRDPLYGLEPENEMRIALEADWWLHDIRVAFIVEPAKNEFLDLRDATLLKLAIRALRNQGQPYYDRQP